MNRKILNTAACLLLLTASACAGAKVVGDTQSAPITKARPDTVVVYPFAVTPSEVTLNQSFIQRAYRSASGVDQDAQQLQLADQTAHNICVQVAADLTKKGISAACFERGAGPSGSNVLIVEGQFTDINEGNRLRRMVIGLGAGQATLDTDVIVFQKTDEGSQQVMEFATHADSGYMPGVGVTGPAGAAAGGAAAAATVGANVAASGVKNYTSSTGFLADKTVKQVTDQISSYYAQQGWGGWISG